MSPDAPWLDGVIWRPTDRGSDTRSRQRYGRTSILWSRRSMAENEDANTIVVVTTPVIDLFHGIATGEDSASRLDLEDTHGVMLNRESAIADTVDWILAREDRVVLAAHNAHVQRQPNVLPGIPPVTTMGMQLADRLGRQYLVVGMTTATGQTLNTTAEF